MNFSRAFRSPVFAHEEQTRRARTLHFILWSLLLVFDTQFFVFFFLMPEYWQRWLGILLTFNFTLPPLLLLNRRGRTRVAGMLLISMLWTLATVLAFSARGIYGLGVLMFIVFVLIAGLLFGERGGVKAAIIFGLTALSLALVEKAGFLPSTRINYTALSISVMVIMCLELIAIFQFMANRSITAALKEATQNADRYREVYETTSDSIFLIQVTADGRFLGAGLNPACEKLLGVTSEEILGKPPDQVIAPEAARNLNIDMKRCVAQGAPVEYERTSTSLYGYRYHVYTILIPIKDDEGRVSRIVGVAHNITERKEAEDALRRSHDELETRVKERTAELEKVNKELEAFSYSVSHDLRRPLRSVTGFTDLLVSEYGRDLPADAQNLLNMTRESAVQMNQLIDALLNLSRIEREPLVLRPVSMAGLARQTANELRAESPDRDIVIRVADLPECVGDPALLRQVFDNLLSNSIKFSRARPVAMIEVGFKAEDGKTVYFVRDNGVGFDMSQAGKLFAVFQRLHSTREFGGTGIGLSIVLRIIHRHGGTVWAEAAIDQGATFYFTLPRTEQTPKDERADLNETDANMAG